MTFPFPTFVPVVAAGGDPVAISFLTSSTSSANASSYTFSSLSFGAADSNRVLIVAIGARQNSAGSISSVTIGGVTATAIATANNSGGGSEIAAIYAANVPTGTSGDVVVNFSGTYLRCAVGLYSMSGAGGSVTAHDTATATPSGSSPSTTIDVEANGAILAVCFGNASAATSAAWTGLTEAFDVNPETTSNVVSGAHDEFASAETGRTITATITSVSAEQSLAVASWSPA